MTNPIMESLCKEKHKAIDEKLATIFHHEDEFYDALSGMTSFVATQTQLVGDLIKSLDKIDKRVEALERVPQSRYNNIVDTVVRYATLGLLGLMAIKIGM